MGFLSDQNGAKSAHNLNGFYGTSRKKKNRPTGFLCKMPQPWKQKDHKSVQQKIQHIGASHSLCHTQSRATSSLMTKRMSFSTRHLRSSRSCGGRHASSPDGAMGWRTPSVLLRTTVWNFWLNSRSPRCEGLETFSPLPSASSVTERITSPSRALQQLGHVISCLCLIWY